MSSTRYTKANSEYSYSTSPPPGDTDYSAGGWVRFVSRANTDAIFFIGPSDGNFPGDYDVVHLAGSPAIYWQISCADNYAENTSFYNDGVANDVWYHILFVADGGTSRLYVGGVERCSVSHTRSARTAAGHMRFGAGMNYFNYLDGEMAGWKVWDRALTAAEAAAEAQSYAPVQTLSLRGAYALMHGNRTGDMSGLARTLTEVNTPTDGTATPPPIAFRRMPFVGTPAAASGGGTGELSATITTTISATGTLAIAGTSSTTVSTTVSSAGALAIAGTSSTTVSATISAAGVLPIVAASSVSVETSLASAGVLPIVGTLSATIETTISASSSAAIVGTASVSVDTTISATGVLPILGTASPSVSTTLSATGTSAITGQASVTVTTSLSATGTLPITGALSSTVTSSLSATGATPRSGTASVTITTTLVAVGAFASRDWLADILTALRDAVSDALDGVVFVQDNAPSQVTAAQWATVSVVFDSAAKATIGAAHTRSTGHVDVTIYTARDRGDVDILTIGERVISALQSYDSAAPYVRCRNASFLGPQGYRDAWASRTVRAAVVADVF